MSLTDGECYFLPLIPPPPFFGWSRSGGIRRIHRRWAAGFCADEFLISRCIKTGPSCADFSFRSGIFGGTAQHDGDFVGFSNNRSTLFISQLDKVIKFEEVAGRVATGACSPKQTMSEPIITCLVTAASSIFGGCLKVANVVVDLGQGDFHG